MTDIHFSLAFLSLKIICMQINFTHLLLPRYYIAWMLDLENKWSNRFCCWPVQSCNASGRKQSSTTLRATSQVGNILVLWLLCDMHTVPKAFYLPIFPCVHRALTVCSLALSTPFTLTVHKVLTVCSQNVHLGLTVHSGFT